MQTPNRGMKQKHRTEQTQKSIAPSFVWHWRRTQMLSESICDFDKHIFNGNHCVLDTCIVVDEEKKRERKKKSHAMGAHSTSTHDNNTRLRKPTLRNYPYSLNSRSNVATCSKVGETLRHKQNIDTVLVLCCWFFFSCLPAFYIKIYTGCELPSYNLILRTFSLGHKNSHKRLCNMNHAHTP